ncbi:conserved membrane protein, unknown function [Hepatocystis sp. ex Piliocolobus tephrosceles]|nr:conserved membrane protein, unknown function [Hepatocystis sp. ex Piliocolobus tephrosceles]
MSNSKYSSTRVASFMLYSILLIYSLVVIIFGVLEYKYQNTYNLLILCVIYGLVIICVCIVGCYGIIKESATSIRSTIILLIVNNIIMTMLISFLFIDILHYPHIVTVHRASKYLQYIVKDKRIGLLFCAIVYFLIFVSFCFMWTISDYLAKLDAQSCLDDLRNIHNRQKSMKKKNAESLNKQENECLIKV